jgi:hypothetical protein
MSERRSSLDDIDAKRAPHTTCRREHHHERGREPPDPSRPEGAETNGPALHLAEEDPRDQVAAEHEEDVDPEEPGPAAGGAEVPGEDGPDGHAAEPVERRVAAAGLDAGPRLPADGDAREIELPGA